MLKLNPVFKDYIWGGDKLKTLYHKKSDLSVVAESWELSTHKDGMCRIAEGPSTGETLEEYLGESLPILIKFIDARDHLSVQVHPDDDYALKNEGDLGKTEMWYVLEAEEGAQLVYGFKKDITKEEFNEYIEKDTLTEVLNTVEVRKGDVFFITPGTIHAIGKGIMIAEIQQCSNVTYRVYDYGRVGADGKPRKLHVDKAIETTTLTKAENPKIRYSLEKYKGYSRGVLVSCQYFTTELLDIDTQAAMEAVQETFQSLLVLEGEIKLYSQKDTLYAVKGESIFIPKGYGKYKIEGTSKVILVTL